MHVEAAGDETVDYVLDLGVGGAFLHYDYHGCGWFPFAGLKPGHYNSRALQNRRMAYTSRYDFSSLSTTPPKCMAWRSALRASSMMRSNRRRMAASVSGPGLTRSAFSRTSRSRSG